MVKETSRTERYFALKSKKSGNLLRVELEHYDDEEEYSLEDYPDNPVIYKAKSILSVMSTLQRTGNSWNNYSDVDRPLLGGINPEDLIVVFIEEEVKVMEDVVEMPAPLKIVSAKEGDGFTYCVGREVDGQPTTAYIYDGTGNVKFDTYKLGDLVARDGYPSTLHGIVKIEKITKEYMQTATDKHFVIHMAEREWDTAWEAENYKVKKEINC